MIFHPAYLAVAVTTALAFSAPVAVAQTTDTTTSADIERILVTGEALNEPATVITDPRKPRQPLPAHDGADYLKTIPGFSVTRKGGADGDALFRGMAGSRLGILVDGENILGGCNSRMDAPTAYIYPELHNSLTVIKGPQSVQHGAGHSAATILFERKTERFDRPGYRLHASALGASFGRADQLADLQLGNQSGYILLNGSHSRADNYQDGDGNKVHSEYYRYSANAAVGWTPDDDTRLELSVTRSDGEAAYADRGMDGTKFLRDSVNLRFEKQNISSWLHEVKLHLFDNDVDHVMDDQKLRQPGMMGYANVTRDTRGGRLSADFIVTDNLSWLAGIDRQENSHGSRSAPPSGAYSDMITDADLRQQGLFTELTYQLAASDKIVAGYRLDQWKARDKRDTIKQGMMSVMPNPTADETRKDNLHSAFARYEYKLQQFPATVYAGIGHTARFPDYWELIAKEGQSSISGFDIKPEETTQLDIGTLYKTPDTEFSASAFYNKVHNFIVVDYSNMMKMNGFVQNVDATSYGAELGITHALTKHWKVDGTVAYVRGENTTDNTPLPQLSPLEIRTGLSYTADNWSVGSLIRVVDRQNRYDLDKGNIVGKDLGASSGFAIYSLNASWKPTENLLFSAGVDNLFDKTYAEFVSRASGNGMGGGIPGFIQTERVNEPGRTFWLKLQLTLDK
ncbi:TonB-dependent copper receptor [Chromatiaceae bacterium AAb-1]|nr:TonB-dependent copper receptor [Chromatiaceae bacterium AAb-1]